MLRKLRVVAAAATFTLITLYFLDFAGWLPESFHGLVSIQFLPAVLSLSLVTLAGLILATLLFGRIYCSVVCPTGIFQDIVNRIAGRLQKKRKRFAFAPAKTILRWSVLGVVVVTYLFGLTVVLSLLDPYGAYGRLVLNVFSPVYMAGNNLLEAIFTKFDNYTFYRTEVAVVSPLAFIVALATFGIIGFLAWKHGRSYCNTICPVGTLLGFLSKYALFKIRIDKNNCNGCGVCASKCKASCIDRKTHTVDYSRCIACFDCLDNCRQQAIQFSSTASKAAVPLAVKKGGIPQTVPTSSQPAPCSPPETAGASESPDRSRRQFLGTLLATAALLPEAFARKQEELLSGRKGYKRQHPLCPPGAVSPEHLLKHCTACHLCIAKCPSHVLKPAVTEYGLGGVMQPVMYFDRGFCNFDCTVCSDVCPNGAIHPLTVEQKHLTQVGRVVFIKEDCIVYADETSCGACSEHCPTQAVTMIPYKEGLTIPSIDPDICVGCGGCEYVCPARPFRAIHVEGNPVQQQAKPFERTGGSDIKIDDFGF